MKLRSSACHALIYEHMKHGR